MAIGLPDYKRVFKGDFTYLICAVRNATNKEKKILKRYVSMLRNRGEQVLYPEENTDQEDVTGGCRIVRDHVCEISDASKIRVAWNPNSRGSYVDVGTAFPEYFLHGKQIYLANKRRVEAIVKDQLSNGVPKSYEMVLLEIDEDSRKQKNLLKKL